jgi:hypothetical protein
VYVLPVACTSLALSLYVAATEMNMKLKFRGLRVYGLLTDLSQFKFYSYDPSTVPGTFCFDETLLVDVRRTKSLSDMMDGLVIFYHSSSELTYLPAVADKIFSIILTAYIDGLGAIIQTSNDGAHHRDASIFTTSSYKLLTPL